MRGDQLALQFRIIRKIEAGPNGLNAAEIAEREETGISTIYRDLEVLQAGGFPLYTERADRANRIVSRKGAKFAKKSVLHLPPLNIIWFNS